MHPDDSSPPGTHHHGTTTPRGALPVSVEEAARLSVEAAFRVHRTLGPGLTEKVSETCFLYECRQLGLSVSSQVSVPIQYGDIRLDAGLRLDVVVNDCLIVERKAVEALLPLHHAQLMTYLELTGHRLGLLINCNTALLRDGIKRVIL